MVSRMKLISCTARRIYSDLFTHRNQVNDNIETGNTTSIISWTKKQKKTIVCLKYLRVCINNVISVAGYYDTEDLMFVCLYVRLSVIVKWMKAMLAS